MKHLEHTYKTSAEDLFKVSIDCTPDLPVEEPTYPNNTKEEWELNNQNHREYFEQEYERLKTWYSEETKKAVGNEWIPLDTKKEPTKTELILDEEIISMAKGFMVGPVGLYNGRAVAAETHRYDNLAEMQIFLKAQSKNQDMVLYMTYKKNNMYWFRGTFVPVV